MRIDTAMVLAAGRGNRMRPLTDTLPKPLAPVAGKPLIAHTIERLARAGIERIVINLSWRGQQIREALGNGAAFGVQIQYSDEGEVALETGGGIVQALPLLGLKPFWVVSGDIWLDYPFVDGAALLHSDDLVRLVMVPNPDFHKQGDFWLRAGRIENDPTDARSERLTYGNLGLFRPELFEARKPGVAPLSPWLREAIAQSRVSGERFDGTWCNVGTIEQLAALNATVDKTTANAESR